MNEKNAFSLDFINHMHKMLGEPTGKSTTGAAGEMTNFQLASTTLDAGVKIYSYRVDSVYTEAFKLMGGLNRTNKTRGDAIGEEDEDARGGGRGWQRRRRASNLR